jgi:hypothetical protein
VRKAEVGDLHTVILRDQNVGRLQIAVDDAFVVQPAQALSNLDVEVQIHVRRELLRHRLNRLFEVAAADELRDDEEVRVFEASSHELQNVGVPQTTHDFNCGGDGRCIVVDCKICVLRALS